MPLAHCGRLATPQADVAPSSSDDFSPVTGGPPFEPKGEKVERLSVSSLVLKVDLGAGHDHIDTIFAVVEVGR